jgi:hypothetical protein
LPYIILDGRGASFQNADDKTLFDGVKGLG